MKPVDNQNLFHRIAELIQGSKSKIVREINQTMVHTYFEIGRHIFEHEQDGELHVDYGTSTLPDLSKALNKEFGRGFSVQNLRQMRQFYLTYKMRQTLSVASQKLFLSWSHYTFLMRIEEPSRQFYERETINNQWSLRELKRQFDSALYERLALSRDKEGIRKLAEEGQIIEMPKDLIKDPYILDFLELKTETQYSETELEQAIIDKLEHFLLELGKGFTYVERQSRITFSEKHFYIDLVFYNRILQSFVLIDLKIGELKHQDLGQMQMYVNYYDREKRLPYENKTIGIVICRLKDDAVIEYTLPEDNEQIFASQYSMVLPDKEQLKQLLAEY
jgi:predicted nuclease of restriction endonuclease-like (RecB) superfamily